MERVSLCRRQPCNNPSGRQQKGCDLVRKTSRVTVRTAVTDAPSPTSKAIVLGSDRAREARCLSVAMPISFVPTAPSETLTRARDMPPDLVHISRTRPPGCPHETVRATATSAAYLWRRASRDHPGRVHGSTRARSTPTPRPGSRFDPFEVDVIAPTRFTPRPLRGRRRRPGQVHESARAGVGTHPMRPRIIALHTPRRAAKTPFGQVHVPSRDLPLIVLTRIVWGIYFADFHPLRISPIPAAPRGRLALR